MPSSRYMMLESQFKNSELATATLLNIYLLMQFSDRRRPVRRTIKLNQWQAITESLQMNEDSLSCLPSSCLAVGPKVDRKECFVDTFLFLESL